MNLSFFCGLSLITLAFTGPTGPATTTHLTACRQITNSLIGTNAYVVDPVVKIGAYFDTQLTVQQILKSPFLQVHTPGDTSKHAYGIHYFKMIVEYASGDVYDTEVRGSHLFSPAQITIIKKLQPGDSLFFEMIKGTVNGDKTIAYPFFRINIK